MDSETTKLFVLTIFYKTILRPKDAWGFLYTGNICQQQPFQFLNPYKEDAAEALLLSLDYICLSLPNFPLYFGY
jgi:hypothetical protein